jgi:hypothetical protein
VGRDPAFSVERDPATRHDHVDVRVGQCRKTSSRRTQRSPGCSRSRRSVPYSANAAGAPQPAWSLLFTALWYGHHVLGLHADGGVLDTLAAARRIVC